MTSKVSGIYALWWEYDDSIYVGMSQNIEHRISQHCNTMIKGNHHNYLVQEKFNSIKKLPTCLILEEVCDIDSLPSREIFWVKELDTLRIGLNISEPGELSGGYGVNCAASKYSKLQILWTFRLLYNSRLNCVNIQKLTGVSRNNIIAIKNGKIHIWLSNQYPYLYHRMLVNRSSMGSGNEYYQNKEAVQVISPEGVVYIVNSVRGFAREHNLYSSGLSLLINNKLTTHKGWRLFK